MKHVLSRRQFTAAIGAAGVSLALGTKPVWSSVEFGDYKVSTLSDGHLVLPRSFMLPDISDDDLKALLADKGGVPESFEPPCNLTLAETGDRKILFDAGSGPNFMPSAGKIAQALDAAGLAADDITDVVFTHGHPDHLWGIVDDFDEIAFPSAALHLPKPEWDFWYDEETVDKMGEARKTFAIGARNRLLAMEDQVNLFDWGSEVLPGIEAVDTSGHTPGHTSYVLHSGSDGLMVLGDAILYSVISFARPQWLSGSDQDPEKGIETRMKLLDRLVSEKMMIVGYHLSGGGMGRAEADGPAYRFVPSSS